MSLRKKLIRLAHEKPELREHLLPLLKSAAKKDLKKGDTVIHLEEDEPRMKGKVIATDGGWTGNAKVKWSDGEVITHLQKDLKKTASSSAGDDYPYKNANDIRYGLDDRGGASAFLIPLIFHFVGLPPIRGGWSEIKKRSDEAHSALSDFYKLIDQEMRKKWRVVQAITEDPNAYVDGYKDPLNDWSGVEPKQWQKAFAKYLR